MRRSLLRAHRNTIFIEPADIISHRSYEAAQHVMRFGAPKIAATAEPGSFVHIRCGEALEMRRPMSILGVDPQSGFIDVLFKVVGKGTALLARQPKHTRLSLMGPIGRPFCLTSHRRPLLIGGGVGIPPMLFLADRLKDSTSFYHPMVIMGSEVAFPLDVTTSTRDIPGLDTSINACARVLEDIGIDNRLASMQDYPGCFKGYVTELADRWLATLGTEKSQVAVYACGPTPMLSAVAALARKHELPCQVSLEEYMACAVGGCAGCTVPVKIEGKLSMQRVCVDGPVFDAESVFFADRGTSA